MKSILKRAVDACGAARSVAIVAIIKTIKLLWYRIKSELTLGFQDKTFRNESERASVRVGDAGSSCLC